MRVEYCRYRSKLMSIMTVLVFCGALTLLSAQAWGFTFAVASDPHEKGETWINALTEIRDMTVNPDSKFSPPEVIIVDGDTIPPEQRYGEIDNVFKDADNSPVVLPVIGNWDSGAMPPGKGPKGPKKGPKKGPRPEMKCGGTSDAFKYIRDEIIAKLPNAVSRNNEFCDYYIDHKNVRFISIDGFSCELGKGGIINKAGRDWIQETITSAPAGIDHVFIATHVPPFPRIRHTRDGFVENIEERNAFWDVLVANRDKVRAVFVGHTHRQYRLRVLDPSGAAANDTEMYPDEEGGIYQVDVGTAGGRGNETVTFVQVQVDGKNISFRTLEAENGKDKPFHLKDEWNMVTE